MAQRTADRVSRSLLDERSDIGKAARERAPRDAIGDWRPSRSREDPLRLLDSQATTRLPDLVPVRYGRMLASPLAFYRGAALLMAADLAGSPISGLTAQVCGDAHLSNFGIFGSPERELLFDVNDFDETLPGPWEWDVMRLAASLSVAGRHCGIDAAQREAIITGCARSYRTAMRDFARTNFMDVWYTRLDTSVIERWRSQLSQKQVKKVQQIAAKARAKDSSRALRKLTTTLDGGLRFLSQPPLLTPVSELLGTQERTETIDGLSAILADYQSSLRPELQHLLANYRVIDMARKVVGVGSVGTRAFVLLLEGRGPGDALVLQAKEANASVLERFVGASAFDNHGQRVVIGQRSMQAASDILLGWVRVTGMDGVVRDFYVRQLWDWKGSVELDGVVPSGLRVYGEMCGWTLARAHARTGDAVAIAAYLGSRDVFDRALNRFAESYADQNELDFRELAGAVADGRVEAAPG